MRVRRFACCLLASLASLVAAGAAAAAPNGAPARISTLGSWRTHDPAEPVHGAQRWTPADVAGFLALYPTAYMDLGYRDAAPAGNRYWRDKGREVDQLQALLAEQAVPDGLGRICVTDRPDIHAKLIHEGGCEPSEGGEGCSWEGDMDGTFGEAETVVTHSGVASRGQANRLEDDTAHWEAALWRSRLLVLRPGAPDEERRRITASGSDTLTVASDWTRPPAPGDAYEIRGSFDPRWIQRVPRAVHEAAVREHWTAQRNVCGRPGAARPCPPAAEPLDPFALASRRAWPDWLDAEAIRALATPATVPALYGPVRDATLPDDEKRESAPWTDPFFRVSSVVMDVRDPAYRDWRIRYLMYKLRDYGLAPGEPTCIVLTYKPGWYTYYDEAARGPSGDVCAIAGSKLWTGPAHVCADGSAPGGPLVSGLYGPGEYERSINAYIREMIAKLAERGWTGLRIIMNERPTFTSAKWAILDDDVRRSPAVIGEWQGPIEPKLAELRGRPGGAPAPPAAPPPEPPTAGDGGSPAAGASGGGGPAGGADGGGFVTRAPGSGGAGGTVEPQGGR